MSKNILPIITPLVIFLVGLGFLGFTYYKNITNKPAALSVTSKYKEATVKLRNKDLGKTPIENTDIKPGTAEIILETKESNLKKQIQLTEKALTVVSADVGISDNFSGTLIIWYDKSNEKDGNLFVSSNPGGAKILINNKESGKTPTTINKGDILDSENDEYSVIIEKDGYESQKVTVKLEPGYTLNIQSDLFIKPIPKQVQKLAESDEYKVYGFTDTTLAAYNPAEWASAIAYWLDTRGTAVFGSDSINYFDYFVDSEGNLYNGKGDGIDKNSVRLEKIPKEALLIGYLNTKNTENLSDEAKKTISGLFGGKVTETSGGDNTYIVKKTGVGYLNVRKTADLDGELLGKLDIGDEVEVVKQEGDWYRIKYKDGENGEAFVYATWLEKKPKEKTEEDNPTPTPEKTPNAG